MLHVQTCWAYDVGQDDAGQHNVLTCWAYDALQDDAGQHKVLSYFSQLVPQVGRLIIGLGVWLRGSGPGGEERFWL
jgi:hypothetical protein